MMKKFRMMMALCAAALLSGLASCSSGESYTSLLNGERNACNMYLANQRVINEIPKDTIFEEGEDAPFYRLDDEGQVYMRVIRSGERSDTATLSEKIYFRYTRYSLDYWYDEGELVTYDTNMQDMSASSAYFKFLDYSTEDSSKWGVGIQMPLWYLGVGSEVWLVVKSQYGLTNEISYVTPFLWHIRYYHSKI